MIPDITLPCAYGGWLFYLIGIATGLAIKWGAVAWHKRWHRYWEKVAMGLERDCERLAKELKNNS